MRRMLPTEPQPQVRLHTEQRTAASKIKAADDKIVEAMKQVGREAPEGMVTTQLAEAGLTMAADRCYAMSLIESLPPTSPLKDAPLDVHLALTSQGHAMLKYLISEAEKHLVDGRPMAFLNRDWADARVRQLKQEAAEARRRDRTPSEPTSVLLARLQRELEEERAKRIEAERIAEEALQLLEESK